MNKNENPTFIGNQDIKISTLIKNGVAIQINNPEQEDQHKVKFKETHDYYKENTIYSDNMNSAMIHCDLDFNQV